MASIVCWLWQFQTSFLLSGCRWRQRSIQPTADCHSELHQPLFESSERGADRVWGRADPTQDSLQVQRTLAFFPSRCYICLHNLLVPQWFTHMLHGCKMKSPNNLCTRCLCWRNAGRHAPFLFSLVLFCLFWGLGYDREHNVPPLGADSGQEYFLQGWCSNNTVRKSTISQRQILSETPPQKKLSGKFIHLLIKNCKRQRQTTSYYVRVKTFGPESWWHHFENMFFFALLQNVSAASRRKCRATHHFHPQ